MELHSKRHKISTEQMFALLDPTSSNPKKTMDTKAKLDWFMAFNTTTSKRDLDSLLNWINSYRVSTRSSYLERPDINSTTRCKTTSTIPPRTTPSCFSA